MLERDRATFRGPDFQVLGRILLLGNDSKCDSHSTAALYVLSVRQISVNMPVLREG